MRLVEHELTDALSASRNTVRAVLQQLAREGLVTREPKNGTRAAGSLLLPIDELTRSRLARLNAVRSAVLRWCATAYACRSGGLC